MFINIHLWSKYLIKIFFFFLFLGMCFLESYQISNVFILFIYFCHSVTWLRFNIIHTDKKHHKNQTKTAWNLFNKTYVYIIYIILYKGLIKKKKKTYFFPLIIQCQDISDFKGNIKGNIKIRFNSEIKKMLRKVTFLSSHWMYELHYIFLIN